MFRRNIIATAAEMKNIYPTSILNFSDTDITVDQYFCEAEK